MCSPPTWALDQLGGGPSVARGGFFLCLNFLNYAHISNPQHVSPVARCQAETLGQLGCNHLLHRSWSIIGRGSGLRSRPCRRGKKYSEDTSKTRHSPSMIS